MVTLITIWMDGKYKGGYDCIYWATVFIDAIGMCITHDILMALINP